MPRENFTVIGRWTAVVDRSTLEEDPDPFEQAISGLMLFTPSRRIVRSQLDACTYILEPKLGRITNGVLCDVPMRVLNDAIPKEQAGDPADPRRYGLRLTANTEALGPIPGGLDYRVDFSRVVFNKRDQRLEPFVFTAPETDEVLDLSQVVHRNTKIPVRR